jgi:hypothetical protein
VASRVRSNIKIVLQQVEPGAVLALADLASFKGTTPSRAQLEVLLVTCMPASQDAAAALLQRARTEGTLSSATSAAKGHGIIIRDLKTGYEVLCQGGRWEPMGSLLNVICAAQPGQPAPAEQQQQEQQHQEQQQQQPAVSEALALQLGRLLLQQYAAHGGAHGAHGAPLLEPTNTQLELYRPEELEIARSAPHTQILGQGGFGQVLRVELRGKCAALKVPAHGRSDIIVELTWARALPNVVRVLGYGTSRG